MLDEALELPKFAGEILIILCRFLAMAFVVLPCLVFFSNSEMEVLRRVSQWVGSWVFEWMLMLVVCVCITIELPLFVVTMKRQSNQGGNCLISLKFTRFF